LPYTTLFRSYGAPPDAASLRLGRRAATRQQEGIMRTEAPSVPSTGLRSVKPLRHRLPGRIRAQRTFRPDEHFSGFGVVLEHVPQPARRDVRELASARMEYRRRMAGILARTVEDRHVVDELVVRLRGLVHEVHVAAVDHQHGTVQSGEILSRRESGAPGIRA